MGNFLGGSAYNMASQIAEGYQLLTATSLRRFSPAELGQLRFELQKLLTDLRAAQPPANDLAAVKLRHRKIGRVNNALQVIQHRLGGGR